MDQGVEAITDAAERAQVRRQAQRVQIKSGLLALLLTALCLLLPRR